MISSAKMLSWFGSQLMRSNDNLKRPMNKTCSVLNKIKAQISGKRQNSTKEIRVENYKRNVKNQVMHRTKISVG